VALTLNAEHREAAACAQETEYGEGYNYAAGSPHIRHTALREPLESRIFYAHAGASIIRRTILSR
jgi:hypothetical protein